MEEDMDFSRVCPGSKPLRQPAPEIFICSSCGEEVEIWTDEVRRDCSSCGKHDIS